MSKGSAYLAEFVATFTLCFVGAGAICTDALTGGQVGLVGIALAHGLALAVGITATAAVSGGHVNPAVTFGFAIVGRLPWGRAAGYVVSQLAGASLAGWLLTLVFPPDVRSAVAGGTPVPGPGVAIGTVVLVEAILTFFLAFAVFGTAVDARAPRLGGLLIGLTVTFDILVGGPLTGASMNPARTFGPGLAAGVWTAHWAYWVGPLLGAAAAAVVYERFLAEKRA